MVWRNLDGRPIANLIDLPLITDPEMQAATDMLSGLDPSCLLCRVQLILLARMPHRERQHDVRDERGFGKRLWLFWIRPRRGLSPLQRGFLFHQARGRLG